MHPLRFDFAIFNCQQQLQCLIEYQGQEHYHNTFRLPEEKYQAFLERDEQKRQYCRTHNITLYELNKDDNIDEFILDIMEITNSECFSSNFASIVTIAKAYAFNYISTEDGKTFGEVKYAVERLNEMIDCLNFNYLAHVNGETEFEAEYEDGNISVEKGSYAYELIVMVNAVNNIILNIAQSIYDGDRGAVLENCMELFNEELYKLKPITR
jgi:hypothetical protein